MVVEEDKKKEVVIYQGQQRRDNKMHLTLPRSNHIHKFAEHFHCFRAKTFHAKRHTRTPSDTTHNTCHLRTLGDKSRTTAVTRHLTLLLPVAFLWLTANVSALYIHTRFAA